MDETEFLAQQFEAQRSHLRAVAYRMLGSVAEADDAVQEAWLRLARTGREGIEDLRGWLTTVTGRICLDALRRRSTRADKPPCIGACAGSAARHTRDICASACVAHPSANSSKTLSGAAASSHSSASPRSNRS